MSGLLDEQNMSFLLTSNDGRLNLLYGDTDSVLSLNNNPWATKSRTISLAHVQKKRPPIKRTFSTPAAKLEPVPTSSHPLDHDTNGSLPISHSFFSKKYPKNEDIRSSIRRRRTFAPLGDDSNVASGRRRDHQELQKSPTLRNRRSLPEISVNTIAHSSETQQENSPKEQELKMVIVHVVKSEDTLQGISLFYGIESSVLKKVNKLWTNDSIHMHKYLYIPLDECTLDNVEGTIVMEDDCIHIAKHYRSSMSESSRPSTPSSFTLHEREYSLPAELYGYQTHGRTMSNVSTATIWSNSSLASSSSPTSNGGSSPSTTTTITSAEVQKLPATQLSYFPPHRAKTSSTLSTNNVDKSHLHPQNALTPSPIPVAHYQRNKSVNLSFPSPTPAKDIQPTIVDKLLTTLDVAGEKYLKRRFSSIKRNSIRGNGYYDSTLLLSLTGRKRNN